MSRLARTWGSGTSQSKPFSNPENAKFGDSHPELNLFVTFALARELQNASPKNNENKPLMEWNEAYENAEWDHTLRDEKFALFLAGRQIDRVDLPEEKKIESKQVLGNLVKLGNQCLEDNRLFGNKDANDFRQSQSLDREYSNLLTRHDKAKSFLQSAKNFHPQTPELTHLRNGLVAMATRAVTGLKASLDACETVIKERHDVGVETYGKDIIDLIESNPERLDLVFRAKDTPIVFEPSMVPKFIDSLGKGTNQQPGDQKTASVCRNAWNLISRQVDDPTLGQQALKHQDAFNNFGKMDTNRLIEVTKAHEEVVGQIQSQLSEVRGRQQTLSKDAPKILHDSLASFANALEKRLEHAAGPLEESRKELASRRNKASENADTFENRFGNPLTDLLESQVGEVFEGIPRVGVEHVGSVATTARQTPGFALVQKNSPGLIDRLVSHIGKAERPDSLTGKTSADLKVMTNSQLDSVIDDSSRLFGDLENDLSSIDEALEMLATPSGEGHVARDQADNVLVSFLVAAKAALTMQRDALGPVKQAASEVAAGRGALSFATLMPNLHKATSGISPTSGDVFDLASTRGAARSATRSNSPVPGTGRLSPAPCFSATGSGMPTRPPSKTGRPMYKANKSDRSTKTFANRTNSKVSARMVKTGEAEWKDACRQLERIKEETKPILGIVGGDPSTYHLASAILQDLQSIDFERMRGFVSETLSSLARI